MLIAFSLATAATKEAEEGIDAVLLLDASGSMRLTDPLKLRHEATRLFTQFLRSNDRLAIIEFAGKTKIIRPLLEYNQSQDADVANAIKSVEDSGEHTDLHAAVNAAWELLKNEKRANAEPVIILFSDGMLEPPSTSGTANQLTERLLEELLPELRTASVRVYSLAFSEQSDKDLLAQISGITNAVSWYAATANKIHEHFAEMFLTVKKPQMQPLTSRGFKIDRDIQEATFYINREQTEEVTLITPSKIRITKDTREHSIKWYSGELFDVITINTPESGQWQLSGLSKNLGFATLLTNLKLNTNWPAAVVANEPVVLEARLFEFNKPVALPDMSEAINYAFQITPIDKISGPIIKAALRDNGKDGDKFAGDGIFSAEVNLKDEGEYRMQVVASAPTFERRQQVSFRVKPPLVKVGIVPAKDALIHSQLTNSEKLNASDVIRIELSPEVSGLKINELNLLATSKKRKIYKLAHTKIDNYYEAEVSKLPHDGEYTITATLLAEGRRGSRIQAESQALDYVYVPKVNDEPAAEIVVEEKKEVVQQPAGFPWLYLLILLLVNSGLGYAALMQIKKMQVTAVSTDIGFVFLDIAAFQNRHQELEQLKAVTNVDLSDPIFFEQESSISSSSGALKQASTTDSSEDTAPSSDTEEVTTTEEPDTEVQDDKEESQG